MRIGLDARLGKRHINSGLSRVTRNLVEGLLELDQKNQYVILVKHIDSSWKRFGEKARVVKSEIRPFSLRDFVELPRLFMEKGVEVAVLPQFYMPPFFRCHSVRMIHDLWAVLHPEWLPSRRDFIRAHGRDGLAGVFASTRYFLRLYRRDLIFPHNEFIRNEVKVLRPQCLHMGALARMALTLYSADRIVVPSEFVKRQIEEYFEESVHKTEVIPNCVSPEFFSTHESDRQNYLLHVSKWEPRKNIEVLLNAVKLARERVEKDIKLVMVGNHEYSEYGNRILKLISQAPYSAFVSNLGVVDDSELVRLYSSAFGFVFPSLDEGFGIPVAEAMATGTLVITSNVSALPEVTGNAAILVDPRNPEEIADAIVRLFHKAKARQRLAKFGLKIARSFERARYAKALLATIEEAASTATKSLPGFD